MASKQRVHPPKKRTRPLADLGIFDLPDLDVMGDDNESDIDESTLESELEAILSGKTVTKPARPKKKDFSPLDIERIAAEAECIEDVEVEDEDEDDDSLNDPDLLKELKSLSCEIPEEVVASSEEVKRNSSTEFPVSKDPPSASHPEMISPRSIVTVLEERLKLYIDAIAAAKQLNDSSKVRRYSRAEKVLKELIKSAKAGKNINEEDIPPAVSIPKAKTKSIFKLENLEEPSSSSALPSADVAIENFNNIPSDVVHAEIQEIAKVNPIIADLIGKRDEYKTAALKAKKAGDKVTAISYMKALKNLDALIEAVKNGKEVNLSDIPDFLSATATIMSTSEFPKKELDETQQSSSSMEASALSAASEPEDPALFGAPPAPASVLEALHQRLEKFKGTKKSAEAEGNSNKMRRLDRIIKSYEKAIKDYQAGRSVNFEELPTPPGFAPIPIPEEHEKTKPGDTSLISMESKEVPSASSKKPAPSVPSRAAPEIPIKRAAPEPPKTTDHQKSKVQRANSSTVEKQLNFLRERQGMFRQAAVSAKKSGDIEEAKHYLKLMKGFDKMIQACECGLPVDISSIPTPPQLESDFVIVDVQDCVEGDETSLELLENLENDLVNQIEVCNRNKNHFLKLGDVAAASRFEKLGIESRKDLSVICHLKKTGQSPPKFHYETRLFCIVQCNTNLTDSELEVTIERGINLPGKPDDLDSYIKLEFPIPTDCPQKAKSKTVRDTNNPIFEEKFQFQINRKSRSQLRQFKRASLRLEVWSKGGFLRSDSLLGTVSVKLADLESRCIIHDSFDLMEGRKICGGKLEVKVRVRNPLQTDHVEKVKEKWLVIDA